MFDEKFCSLKTFRQFLSDCLFNDSRSGKSDQSPRLRQNNVAKHGKAGCHTAGCRIGQHRNIQKSLFGMLFNGRSCLCHLHQRNHSLLHSCSAGAAIQNNRKTALCRLLKSTGNFLTHNISHTCHQKPGITDAKHYRLTANRCLSDTDCLVQMGFLLKLRNFLWIIRIIQWIGCLHAAKPLLKRIRIRNLTNSRLCLHSEKSMTFRADVGIRHNILFINGLSTFRTLDPQTFRYRRRIRSLFPSIWFFKKFL